MVSMEIHTSDTKRFTIPILSEIHKTFIKGHFGRLSTKLPYVQGQVGEQQSESLGGSSLRRRSLLLQLILEH